LLGFQNFLNDAIHPPLGIAKSFQKPSIGTNLTVSNFNKVVVQSPHKHAILYKTSHPVRLPYQPPTTSTFLSYQTSHRQPTNNTFLPEQINTSQQPNEQAVQLESPRSAMRKVQVAS
jgi:uncharacterized iron-regulated protein